MNRESPLDWDEYYLWIAMAAAVRSKDPVTRVGAVAVKGSSIVTGYNGFPAGVWDSEERWEKPTKYDFVAHAERNALDNAQFDVKRECLIGLSSVWPATTSTRSAACASLTRSSGTSLSTASRPDSLTVAEPALNKSFPSSSTRTFCSSAAGGGGSVFTAGGSCNRSIRRF